MSKCMACREGVALDFAFDMAFQPIVDVHAGRVWGYEALVRGPNGQSAPSVLSWVNERNRYQFDQACRVKAIEAAHSRFDADGLFLSINFLPNAVYEPAACIRATIEAARRVDFPLSQIMFEFTEDEIIRDAAHINRIIKAYQQFGFLTALDDFGAGYAGLSRLADTRTDILKIDMQLIRGVERSRERRAIIHGLAVMAEDMGVRLLAEGVETPAEFAPLADMGIGLFQGFLFGRPSLGAVDSGQCWRSALDEAPRAAAG